MASKKVLVLGGYQPYAAGYLTYHVARILEERFGYEPLIVRLGRESPETSPFEYSKHYDAIDLAAMPGVVSRYDLFLPLAAAWEPMFGLQLVCRKLLYVQGANTFKVLDGFMDGYVSVSTFVQQTLQHLYGLESPVIHPFIELHRLPEPLAWHEREPGSVLMFAKPAPIIEALVRAFMERLAQRHPGVTPSVRVVQRGVPHAELMAVLSRTRYVVALSPTEGFGLLPLEAMASGCAVVGFHGGGGRDYLNDSNSRTTGYPRLDELVDCFAQVYGDDTLAVSLATQGRTDARQFSRDRFDAAWTDYLITFDS